jgi:hypothetical protein
MARLVANAKLGCHLIVHWLVAVVLVPVASDSSILSGDFVYPEMSLFLCCV